MARACSTLQLSSKSAAEGILPVGNLERDDRALGKSFKHMFNFPWRETHLASVPSPEAPKRHVLQWLPMLPHFVIPTPIRPDPCC